MELIVIIALGFICVSFPVILFLYLWYMPWYVWVAYFGWLISCLTSIAFVKDRKKEWLEKLIPSCIITVIFTAIFLISIDTDHYMFDDGDNGIWFFAPALNLPAIYFIGERIRRLIDKQRSDKEKAIVDQLQREMDTIENEISSLEKKIDDNRKALSLLNLLELCGGNLKEIKENEHIQKIEYLEARIDSKVKDMNELKTRIDVIIQENC